MTETDKIKAKLRSYKKKRKAANKDYLSTGSALLNLACTGRVDRGFLRGKYYYLVGDSRSGKTFLSLTCLAEAARNPAFDNYRFIFDDVEGGMLMNVEQFFGRAVAKRLEAPSYGEEHSPIFSNTIEEFYYHIDDAIAAGKPFIYILDSMDSLTSNAEADKFAEQKEAYRSGKQITGSYGDGKAKKNSSGIRQILPHLRQTGSILIVISQTRDNLGFGFEKKTRSGGRALRFYATLEIWSSCGKAITKTVKGKPRIIGMNCILQTKKNRITGRDRKITIPIFYTSGFDDVGGCISWLVDERHWKKQGQKIKAPEFDFVGTEIALIHHIEKGNLEKDLKEIVQSVWDEIEKASDPKRKRRYE